MSAFETSARVAGIRASNETRRRMAEVFNTSGPSKNRRRPREVRRAQDAIAAFCSECCGWDAAGCGSLRAAVEDCGCTECHLYLWRNGTFHLEEAETEVVAAGGCAFGAPSGPS